MPLSNLERKARRKQQTQLAFNPVDKSSSPTRASQVKIRCELTGGKKGGNKKQTPSSSTQVLPGNYSEGEGVPFQLLPTPARSSQVQTGGRIVEDRSSIGDIDGDASPIPTTRKPRAFAMISGGSKRRARGFFPIQSSSESSASEQENENPVNKYATTAKPLVTTRDESEDESKVSLKTANQARTDSYVKTKDSIPSRRRQELIALSESSEDEISILLPRAQETKPSLKQAQSSTMVEDDSDTKCLVLPRRKSQVLTYKINNPESPDEDSDEDVRPSPLKRRRKMVVEEESDDDLESRPLKPLASGPSSSEPEKRISPARIQRVAEGKTKLKQMDSDIFDQEHHPGRSAVLKRPTRQQKMKRQRSEKEKALELMRRKRAGETIEHLPSSGSDENEEGGSSEDELQFLTEFEDDEESPKRLGESGNKKVEADGTAHDSDFVVEDDEGPLGIPDLSLAVPLQFTNASHKPLKEHFRDAIEWLVKNKLYPAFPRDDEVYTLAFRKLDDTCQGLAKSKFTSTQWTKDFTMALYARPHLISGPLRGGEGYDVATGVPKCDACNHRLHIPSSFVQFQGKAYNRNTLVEIDKNSDDDSDDSDLGSHNSKGQLIPRQSEKWFCGRICRQNAEYTHGLIHWKYALQEWVLDALESEGHLTPTALAARNKMKHKQVNRYADQLVDTWHADGSIEKLYRDFKHQLNVAAEVKKGRRGSWK